MIRSMSRVRDDTPQPTMRVTDGTASFSMFWQSQGREHSEGAGLGTQADEARARQGLCPLPLGASPLKLFSKQQPKNFRQCHPRSRPCQPRPHLRVLSSVHMPSWLREGPGLARLLAPTARPSQQQPFPLPGTPAQLSHSSCLWPLLTHPCAHPV